MRVKFNELATGMEWLLGLAAASCLSWCAATSVRSVLASREAAAFGQAQSLGGNAAFGSDHAGSQKTPAAAPIGKLEIRPLKLVVPIMGDYQNGDLLKGVGHVPGTAMPGGLGTMGLAGHRDTYFRPLKGIQKNMDIRVSDKSGTYHYLVDSTEIVTPDNVQVLAVADRPGLTLVTCYPFYFVGSAPKRFIVHAHLVSAAAD